jgi:hypothetical protein
MTITSTPPSSITTEALDRQTQERLPGERPNAGDCTPRLDEKGQDRPWWLAVALAAILAVAVVVLMWQTFGESSKSEPVGGVPVILPELDPATQHVPSGSPFDRPTTDRVPSGSPFDSRFVAPASDIESSPQTEQVPSGSPFDAR